MRDDFYQLIGLVGFIIAGIIFIIIGLRADDMLTVIASVIWIVSCLVWLIPIFKSRSE